MTFSPSYFWFTSVITVISWFHCRDFFSCFRGHGLVLANEFPCPCEYSVSRLEFRYKNIKNTNGNAFLYPIIELFGTSVPRASVYYVYVSVSSTLPITFDVNEVFDWKPLNRLYFCTQYIFPGHENNSKQNITYFVSKKTSVTVIDLLNIIILNAKTTYTL